MSSDASEETTEVGCRHQDSSAPVPESESAPASATPNPSSRVGHLRTWLSAHPLRVETILALASVGLGVLALPIVVFGSFVAIGGETRVLGVGMLVVAAGLLCLVALSVALLVHAYTEISHRGLSLGGDPGVLSVVYGGVRTAETVTAAAGLTSLLASVVALVTLESVPGLLALTAGVAGTLLPTIVLVHAAGTLVGYVFNVG